MSSTCSAGLPQERRPRSDLDRPQDPDEPDLLGEISDFDGGTYSGAYEPVVSPDLWEQVQQILADRRKKNTRTRRFAFSGLITCGGCGRMMVGEIKEGQVCVLPLRGTPAPRAACLRAPEMSGLSAHGEGLKLIWRTRRSPSRRVSVEGSCRKRGPGGEFNGSR